MKTILIPTDFSQNAEDALKYALEFVGQSEARFHLVTVVEPTVVSAEIPLSGVDVMSHSLKSAHESMKALKFIGDEMYGENSDSNITISTEVLVGGVAYMINEEAKKVSADVIIMGTQGTNHSFIDKLIGTISTDVISSAPCPVILIPRDYVFKKIDNIIFPTNLNHGDPYELWRATELIKPNTAKARCLFVIKDLAKVDMNELDTYSKYMMEKSPSIQTFFNVEESKSIEQTIAEYAENFDAELIVMHRTKRNLWAKVFGVKHTFKMAHKLQVPLLVLNP